MFKRDEVLKVTPEEASDSSLGATLPHRVLSQP